MLILAVRQRTSVHHSVDQPDRLHNINSGPVFVDASFLLHFSLVPFHFHELAA